MVELNLQAFQAALQVCKEKEQLWQRILLQVCDAAESLSELPEQAEDATAEVRGAAASLSSSADVVSRFISVLEEVGEAARRAQKRETLLTETGLATGSIGMRCVSLEHLRQIMTDIRFRDGGSVNE